MLDELKKWLGEDVGVDVALVLWSEDVIDTHLRSLEIFFDDLLDDFFGLYFVDVVGDVEQPLEPQRISGQPTDGLEVV